MFLLSKHKKDKQAESEDFVKNLFAKINLRLQVFAEYLKLKANKFTNQRKRVILVVFIISSATESAYVIASSLFKPDKIPITIVPIRKPKTGEESRRSKFTITPKEYKKITDYKRYLDSVNTAVVGKDVPDSRVLRRQGLIDTLRLLETIFINQQKQMLWKRKNGY